MIWIRNERREKCKTRHTEEKSKEDNNEFNDPTIVEAIRNLSRAELNSLESQPGKNIEIKNIRVSHPKNRSLPHPTKKSSRDRESEWQ